MTQTGAPASQAPLPLPPLQPAMPPAPASPAAEAVTCARSSAGSSGSPSFVITVKDFIVAANGGGVKAASSEAGGAPASAAPAEPPDRIAALQHQPGSMPRDQQPQRDLSFWPARTSHVGGGSHNVSSVILDLQVRRASQMFA